MAAMWSLGPFKRFQWPKWPTRQGMEVWNLHLFAMPTFPELPQGVLVQESPHHRSIAYWSKLCTSETRLPDPVDSLASRFWMFLTDFLRPKSASGPTDLTRSRVNSFEASHGPDNNKSNDQTNSQWCRFSNVSAPPSKFEQLEMETSSIDKWNLWTLCPHLWSHRDAAPTTLCKGQCTHPIFSAGNGSLRGRKDSKRCLTVALFADTPRHSWILSGAFAATLW